MTDRRPVRPAEPTPEVGDRGPGRPTLETTGGRRPFTGRDAAGAGMLMLLVNLACAGVGAAVGALVGAVGPLLVAGFLLGFFAGIAVVSKRFRDL